MLLVTTITPRLCIELVRQLAFARVPEDGAAMLAYARD